MDPEGTDALLSPTPSIPSDSSDDKSSTPPPADEALASAEAALILSTERGFDESLTEYIVRLQYLVDELIKHQSSHQILQKAHDNLEGRFCDLEARFNAKNDKASMFTEGTLKWEIGEAIFRQLRRDSSKLGRPQEWSYTATIPSPSVLSALFDVQMGEIRDMKRWEIRIPLDNFITIIGGAMEIIMKKRILRYRDGRRMAGNLTLSSDVRLQWDEEEKIFTLSGEYI